MVGTTGLEPARLSPMDPKSIVSANSTTRPIPTSALHCRSACAHCYAASLTLANTGSCSRGYFLRRAYSMESTSASSEAVMMFSLTPTVPHSRLPSVLWMSTRVLAPVPATPSRIRTL